MSPTNPKNFRKDNSLEHRIQLRELIRINFPDKVAIIINVAENASLPSLKQSRWLVYPDLTVARLLLEVRKQFSTDPQTAIFLMVDKSVCVPGMIMAELVQKYADRDGFLYLTVYRENVFG